MTDNSLALRAAAYVTQKRADQEQEANEQRYRERQRALDDFARVVAKIDPDADVHQDGAGPYVVYPGYQLRWRPRQTDGATFGLGAIKLLVVRPCVKCGEDVEEAIADTYDEGALLWGLGTKLENEATHGLHCPRDYDEDGELYQDEAGTEFPFPADQEQHVYTLAEVRDGTGFEPGARFIQVEP